MKVFNTEEVAFDKFLDDFNSSFFDHNCQHRAEFNSHARTVGWADAPLMSLYQHGLKENFQIAVVMSNIQFISLRTMQAMALKASQKIEGICNGQPSPISPASSSASTPNPNSMDLSDFQRGGPHNQLSDAKCDRQLQLNLCFCCGQARHFSFWFSNRNRKSQGCQHSLSSAWILNFNPISTGSAPTSAPPTLPQPLKMLACQKNGGAQALIQLASALLLTL
ncbi:uncharacterized protein VP01_1867g3 [Puccinia sorghi]|uniref:Uncharacterized protein n=1 Tax=Puccinia sorghi TaxID=27349 RepID=A0A0L6VDF7_9BASI|nr:uncharacterized protein VP01_1867g3 [Puccinia sorghi]